MINLSNLPDAVTILIKDNNVFEEFKKDFPEILADLITFKSNPNCSCRAKVFKFFNEKFEKDSNLLSKYIKNSDQLKIELDKIVAQRAVNNYSGKVVTIPKGEESWKNFSVEMSKGKTYRSFSIVEKENELVVYFL